MAWGACQLPGEISDPFVCACISWAPVLYTFQIISWDRFASASCVLLLCGWTCSYKESKCCHARGAELDCVACCTRTKGMNYSTYACTTGAARVRRSIVLQFRLGDKPYKIQVPWPQNGTAFRTTVPFWGQTTQISSSLSPKRDCGSKGVKVEQRTYSFKVQGACIYAINSCHCL